MRAVEDASALRNSQNFSIAQGKHEEALPLCQRSRAIREKVYGPDHPAVATALNNEASLLQDMVCVVDVSCVLLCVLLTLHHKAGLLSDMVSF